MSGRGWTTAALALAALWLLASIRFPFTLPVIAGSLRQASPDLLLCLTWVMIGAALGWPRAFASLAALALLVVVLYRAAWEAVAAFLPHMVFSLEYVAQTPALVHLVAVHLQWPAWCGVAAGVALLLAVYAAALLAFVRAARMPRSRRHAGTLAAVLAAALAVSLLLQGRAATPVSEAWTGAVVADAWRTARLWLDPGAVEAPIRAEIAAAGARLDATPHGLQRLGGADVYVLVIESYGRLALRHPEVAPALRRMWSESAPALAASTFEVASSTCAPAISGGASWLSHAELFCAMPVPDRRTWELLLASDSTPLPGLFRAAGYRTVELLPAMNRHWPEGQRFYGFDAEQTQLELGYDGFRYGFGVMPDQYVLHRLLHAIVAPAQQPLFAVFVSATSHGPFAPLPAFVADWQIDAATFRDPPAGLRPVSFFAMATDPEIHLAYRDAMVYSLRTAITFTCQLTRPSLVLVLGDHQPPITRTVVPPDPTHDVPVHVLSNRPELLEPWLAGGFVRGPDVPAAAVAFPLAELGLALLRNYSQ